MSKIKDITKELTGRALSPFHRKTGLNQLERNNEMQDGILDGILSQVDDAYITKTEQSNVMHLENSGDGVVVVDSIEGNTMVNILNKNATLSTNGNYQRLMLKPSNNITVINNFQKSIQLSIRRTNGEWLRLQTISTGITNYKLNSEEEYYLVQCPIADTNQQEFSDAQILILEGDWTNKEIPSYFEGLQSSFEEKVNSEGKHEIEILMNNRNLLPKDSWTLKDATLISETKDEITTRGTHNIGGGIQFKLNNLKEGRYCFSITAKTHTQGDGSVRVYNWTKQEYIIVRLFSFETSFTHKSGFFTIPKKYENDEIIIWLAKDTSYDLETQFTFKKDFMLTKVNSDTSLPYVEQKQNKIKLLINEPLRAIDDIKDRLCIKNGKLLVERKCAEVLLDGTQELHAWNSNKTNTNYTSILLPNGVLSNNIKCICDRFKNETYEFNKDYEYCYTWIMNDNSFLYIHFEKSKGSGYAEFKQWLSKNNTKVVYKLEQPIYEEVLNEYGEPILLEGYENGTIYIDSTIVPTTSVRYTPKMEAFSVCNEIQENNVALSSDINDNIITYMMEVDYMITEKELNSASVCSVTQRMEVLDMTSMQKRTFDMLARLFKGKTLTKEECETRVTVYLSAGKITDEQAEELMLLIAETYQ